MATANMGMVLPIPGVTQALGIALPGESWMELQNAAALVLDAHNHTSGMGAPLPAAAMNIDADVDWHGFNIIGLRSTRYTAQAAPLSLAADVGAVYVYGNELWYRDFAGDNVQITDNGSVVGPPGSITGLVPPASAVYAAGAFTWKSDVAAYASMINGSVRIYDQVGAGKYAQITAAPAAGVDYTLTLPPAPPSVTRIITMDAGGALTAKYNVDEATISVAGNTFHVPTSGIGSLQIASSAVIESKIAALNVTTGKIADLNVTTGKIANSGVTTAKIADLNVTRAKLEALGQVSCDITSFVLQNTPVSTDVPFDSGTLVLTGVNRPVLVMLTGKMASSYSVSFNGTGGLAAIVSLMRRQNAGSWVSMMSWNVPVTGSYGTSVMPVFFDYPTYGGGTIPATMEWKLRVGMLDGSSTFIISGARMVAYQL